MLAEAAHKLAVLQKTKKRNVDFSTFLFHWRMAQPLQLDIALNIVLRIEKRKGSRENEIWRVEGY